MCPSMVQTENNITTYGSRNRSTISIDRKKSSRLGAPLLSHRLNNSRQSIIRVNLSGGVRRGTCLIDACGEQLPAAKPSNRRRYRQELDSGHRLNPRRRRPCSTLPIPSRHAAPRQAQVTSHALTARGSSDDGLL
jgi:hypothetical protein